MPSGRAIRPSIAPRGLSTSSRIRPPKQLLQYGGDEHPPH
jgi:hypothetical protein